MSPAEGEGRGAWRCCWADMSLASTGKEGWEMEAGCEDARCELWPAGLGLEVVDMLDGCDG